jgi:hypothetical protein
MYKAKVPVCSDIRTKHSTQSERHVEFLNVKQTFTKTSVTLIFIVDIQNVYSVVRTEFLSYLN